MLSLLTTDIPVTRRKIVEFGAVFFVILTLVVPFIVVWRNGWEWVTWLNWSALIGLVMLLLCLGTGMLMAPVYKIWMRFALVLGTIMTAVIVMIVFFLIITPIGLFRKLFRSKSDYAKAFDRKKDSYWVERKDVFEPRSLEKMY
jgi:hypothetical protein